MSVLIAHLREHYNNTDVEPIEIAGQIYEYWILLDDNEEIIDINEYSDKEVLALWKERQAGLTELIDE